MMGRRALILGTFGLAVAVAVAMGAWLARSPTIGECESVAANTLRTLLGAQEVFRDLRVLDVDRDGRGEYGGLADLVAASTARPAEFVTRSGGPEDELPAGTDLRLPQGFLRSIHGDVVVFQGYCYALYLPTARGPARLVPPTPGGPADRGDADAREQRWICYAWPLERGRTGNRAYVANPQTGEFYASGATQRPYSGPGNIPAPDAALDTAGPNPRNLDASIGLTVAGMTAGDGNTWVGRCRCGCGKGAWEPEAQR